MKLLIFIMIPRGVFLQWVILSLIKFNLLYSHTSITISIIHGFWGQNLVRPTFSMYCQTTIIRGF